MFCYWMHSNPAFSQRGDLMRAPADNDFAGMCTWSPAFFFFWRKSTYLTPGTPGLCNLPSHSQQLLYDCLRNEKAILERAAVWKETPVLQRGPRCQSLGGVTRGQGNYDYATASPLIRLAPNSPEWPLDKGTPLWLMMKLDSSAEEHECFVKRGVSLLFSSGGSSWQDGGHSSFFFFYFFSESFTDFLQVCVAQMWNQIFFTGEFGEDGEDKTVSSRRNMTRTNLL